MFTRLFQALVASALLAVLAGCNAAPAPCIIQRPPLGGYTIEFTRDGGAPAGCADINPLAGDSASGPSSPSKWIDNLRYDMYFGNKLVFKTDELPYYDPTTGTGTFDADGGVLPDSALIATATSPLPTDPTAEGNELYCTSSAFNEVSGYPSFPPLGLGGAEGLYGLQVTSTKFLDGATYQGAQIKVVANITFGSCTANYVGIGVTPSALLGVAPSCRAGDNTPCSPFANPDAGIAIGSGYNQNFPITCRADIGEFFVFGPPPYCLSPNPDGTCDPANVDPDTRQIGVCYLPEGATFPALNP